MKKKTIIIASIVLSLLIIATLAIVLSINHINAENENENAESEVNNEESIVQTDEQLTKSDESETSKDPMDDVVVTLNEDVLNFYGRQNSGLEEMYGTSTTKIYEDGESPDILNLEDVCVIDHFLKIQQFENCPQRILNGWFNYKSQQNLMVERYRHLYVPVWDLFGINGDVSFEKISENKNIEIYYTGEDYRVSPYGEDYLVSVPNDTIQEITYFKINIDDYPNMLEDSYFYVFPNEYILYCVIYQHNKGYVNENDWIKLTILPKSESRYAETTIYYTGWCDTDNNTFRLIDLAAESVKKFKDLCGNQIVTIYDKDGNVVDDDSPIEVGMKIHYFCKRYYETHEYTVVEIVDNNGSFRE